MRSIVQGLVHAVDPDEQATAIAARPDDPAGAVQDLLDAALEPLASRPELRERIKELRRQHDQLIDDVTPDVLIDAGGVVDTAKARSVVTSWKAYLEEHRSEITALELLYSQPGDKSVTFTELRELADRIKRPPHNWTPDLIWAAYEAIEVGKVTHADRHTVTDLVSLVRFTLGADDRLEPFATKVTERYRAWLTQQEQAGAAFTERQRWWLDRMADVIAASAGITEDDLDNVPFTEHGGVDGLIRDLGDKAAVYLADLNRELTA
ncbi:type I restriction-modification enzyme R subunit C-terminal domain-containing protein [Blastococcus sp. TF02A_35]|uniref:type I restriction-modification enzyme R subunit C-terminal domain-containing protein n=1 Tax=Blastococcus sp. TF02A-35 TaxID=2559612 RepID=UPI0010741321|nr:type I restriction-modification enzyme R subunit C-terminal domain-containing protein [Blastococcus sp. TF02A_35]TFV51812.1 hypothetical protein E4P43_09050 [Blastococcus sp. TF02A_35]